MIKMKMERAGKLVGVFPTKCKSLDEIIEYGSARKFGVEWIQEGIRLRLDNDHSVTTTFFEDDDE
jgi:hypothetical protein